MNRKQKISILWSSLAGYSVKFFEELAIKQNCDIQLVYQSPHSEAPYNDFDLSFCNVAIEDSDEVKKTLFKLVKEFSPDCILMCSWNFPHYMKTSRLMKKQGVYVISTIDHQWEGKVKQYLGIITSKIFLRPSIDNFLVAGDRQADFSRKLGYKNPLYGLYAADVEKFKTDRPIIEREKNFIFVGRLVQIKGIQLLIEAYKQYLNIVDDPWGLVVAGTGELETMVANVDGIKYLGFIQPDRLPELLANNSCFILPSLWEPWGVVIHEAAAAGLPIISTYECGAVAEFVRDGRNGYVVPGEVKALKNVMHKISSMPIQELSEMSEISKALAELWNPSKLAKYFIDMQQQN